MRNKLRIPLLPILFGKVAALEKYMELESWKPEYRSGSRDRIGSGGRRKGFCGLYDEIPMPLERPQEQPKKDELWYPR